MDDFKKIFYKADNYLSRDTAYTKFEISFARQNNRFKTYKGFSLALKDHFIEDLIKTHIEDKKWIENIKTNHKDNIKLVENKINHFNDKLKSLSDLFKTYSKFKISKEGFWKNEYVELLWNTEEKKNQFLVDFEYILKIIKELNDDKYKQKYPMGIIIQDLKTKIEKPIDFYQFKNDFIDFVSACAEVFSKIFPEHYRYNYALRSTSVGTLMDFWRDTEDNTFFYLRIPSIKFKDFILYFEKEISEFENKILPHLEVKIRKIERIEHASTNNSFVYILSNKSHPKIYKIGSTSGTPKDRAIELSSTGVLFPHEVAFQIKIKNAQHYEILTHKILDKFRVRENREFFELELDRIKDCLKQVSKISNNGTLKLTLSELKKNIRL